MTASPSATTTQIVTDSNAMLPAELLDRFRLHAVPLTIVIDGVAHLEDTIEHAWFFEQLRGGATITTSAPSPGQLVAAYEAVFAAGAASVLSVHVGSNQSATVDAARLAADQVDGPVHVIDTMTASFIEGCCVWRAAEALEDGGSVEDAEAAATSVAEVAESVFTIGEIDRARAGGRLAVEAGSGVPVYTSRGAHMSELGRVTSVEAARDVMTAAVANAGPRLRVGIGDADAPEAAAALEAALGALPQVMEIVRYTVGPSVAAHTGAGTFGAVFHPI